MSTVVNHSAQGMPCCAWNISVLEPGFESSFESMGTSKVSRLVDREPTRVPTGPLNPDFPFPLEIL